MSGSCASGAHKIQCVAFDMGWTFNILCDVEADQEWQEFRGKGAAGESTWMLKSPSRSVDVEMEQMEVISSDSSDMKVEEAFGG